MTAARELAAVYRHTVIAALDVAAEHTRRGNVAAAAELRRCAATNIALLADVRGWTCAGMRDRLAVLDARAEVRT